MKQQYSLAPSSEEQQYSLGNLGAQDTDRHKILFLGNERSGKSCMIRRFLSNEFSEDYIATVGMDFESDTLFLGGRITKLKILDAAGHSKFRDLLPRYIRGADVVIITYDTTRRDSFESVESWIKTIEEVRKLSEIFLVIVGSKADRVTAREVSIKEGREIAEKYGAAEFFETSAKSGANCKELFHSIAKQLTPQEAMDKKNASEELMAELDGMDDDYYDEEEQSFCSKLCCCLTAFCPCICPKKSHKSVGSHGMGGPTDDLEHHEVFTVEPDPDIDDEI
mmetsp:Transcript_16328/g.24595  ORF Transcript_16328/g.24595 Transcript_16328/m.24595 type:complete len:280 (+) Transcript_16328:41-880(+)